VAGRCPDVDIIEPTFVAEINPDIRVLSTNTYNETQSTRELNLKDVYSATRSGNPRWRRVTKLRARTAKSVFYFDVQGSVAKSTHAGIPWLRYIRQHAIGRVHFWPFDGWSLPPNRSVVAEVYPALWNRNFPSEGRTPNQQDAFAFAKWMWGADGDATFERYFHPNVNPDDRRKAEAEGWILGVA
jgi:hypothetical protein